jgi:hypothetical protein
MKITVEQLRTMERAANREAELERGWGNFKHKVHTSKKTYNRKAFKQAMND